MQGSPPGKNREETNSPKPRYELPSPYGRSPEKMKTTILFLIVFVAFMSLPCVGEVPALKPGVPTAHTKRMIEGWTVRVDDRLLKGEGAVRGERALKLLTARLVAITTVMPEKALAGLRAVNIELDLDYPGLTFMQYHPDVDWLKEQGYSEALAKCVHLPDVEDFLSPFENHRMPWVVLHELVHGYHDQVLGYDEHRIKAAWKKFRAGGKYKSVLTNRWGMHEHYALTSPMELFAEMTESYFGSNDFYPFVAGELQQAEPEIFALMAEIWGPLPQPKPLE
jgi:hypothetical protein